MRGPLDIVHVDGLEELTALGRWLAIVSDDQHSRGEATVLAWAEVHRGVPIIDDGDARRKAVKHQLPAHGSLWVITQAVYAGRVSRPSATSLTNALRAAGARFPFPPDGFIDWATRHGLLTSASATG